MKKIILFSLLMSLVVSCQEDLYDIPRDDNGKAILTDISSTTTTGISTLDGQFSVTAYLPNAKSGDQMTVECLQLQTPTGATTTQLLPLAGTQKSAAVGSDLKATITYTRAEAKLNKAGDYVTVTFAGATESAKQRVDMVPATTTTKPRVSGKDVDVARTDETAFFNVSVAPKIGAYAGTLTAKRKNGKNAPLVDVTGSPFSGAQPFLVPISGADFAAGKDTMYYTFTASAGTYTDVIEYTVIVRDPYFYLKKTGVTQTLGGSSAGRNLLKNAAVAENNANATIAIAGSLILKGGSAWLAAGNTIEFVPTTAAMYTANSTTAAIAAFAAGTPSATADPIAGEGIYIFKIVNGPNPENVIYGMIKVTSVVPGVSVTYEYRIGNLYAHLAVIS
ncbi:MAG TPA: hypothetical protein PLB27_06385 [Bacteroidales bacterium]|nr:hypothetical protein [Bacteroidales bacterium]